jgi:transcription initiation factor TFIID subunit 9B
MTSSSNYNQSEIEIFESLLKSMGIDNYDPNVLTALAEYAHRFTKEILCDSKDYSNHAGRSEIEISDLNLAIELMDSRL